MLERLAFLFNRYISRTSTAGEVDELMTLIEDPQNKEMVQLLLDQVVAGASDDHDLRPGAADDILAAIFSVKEEGEITPVLPLRSTGKWKVWLAAASILVILGIGSYLLLFNKNTPPGTIARIVPDKPAPGSTHATITLADGREVLLDSVTTGTLAVQGAVNVIKNDKDEISYQLTAGGNALTAYNTLTNPRSSKVVSLTLSDGTKVWLNNESSIKYPIAFSGRERIVEITGEAYFEVAHNASKPFHVKKGSTDITVLGTHFNVNAYDDEEALKVTLLEGTVRVTANSHQQKPDSLILKPGQQARLMANSNQLTTITSPDLDQVMSWKKGIFLLDNTDLPTIMRQISRWYDVNVVYETKVANTKFVGGVSKDLPLSKVLKLLEANGLRFELDGKNLKVK